MGIMFIIVDKKFIRRRTGGQLINTIELLMLNIAQRNLITEQEEDS